MMAADCKHSDLLPVWYCQLIDPSSYVVYPNLSTLPNTPDMTIKTSAEQVHASANRTSS